MKVFNFNDLNSLRTLRGLIVSGAVFMASAIISLSASVGLAQASCPSLGSPLSPTMAQAYLMYQRLGAITPSICSPVLASMATDIAAGNMVGAANLVIANEPNFYNITVREMAAIWASAKVGNNQPNTPTNDMVAAVVAVVRDQLPATQLLTGNFTYQVDPTKFAAAYPSLASSLPTGAASYVSGNTQYAFLDTNNINLAQVIQSTPSAQMIMTTAKTLVANPDPAGVITSRAFMQNANTDGTTRSLIRWSFLTFEGIDITDFAGPGPDNMIGRDVDREIGGNDNTFQNQCKTCHNRLDGMRPAFALFDWDDSNNIVLNALYNTGSANNFDANNIVTKQNKNNTVFPGGYAVTSPAWVNNAASGTYQTLFGWTITSGAGANQFGQMIATSSHFPVAMTQAVFQSVCKRSVLPAETATVSALAANFA